MTFLSSGHNPAHAKSRKKHDGSVVSLIDYNCFMDVVDTGDQYRQYYHVRVKSLNSLGPIATKVVSFT